MKSRLESALSTCTSAAIKGPTHLTDHRATQVLPSPEKEKTARRRLTLNTLKSKENFGGARRNRTADLLNAIHVRQQSWGFLPYPHLAQNRAVATISVVRCITGYPAVSRSVVPWWFLTTQRNHSMPEARISKKTVDALNATGREYFVWDTDLTGFGVRVQPSGAKSYVAKYRAGSGRAAPTRRITLGQVGKLTPDEARTLAKKALGSVAHGGDPAAERADKRKTLTISALAYRFMVEHVETKRKKATADQYRIVIEKSLKPAIGWKRVDAVTKADVLALHHDMRDRPFLANRMVAVTSAMFAWAAKVGIVDEGTNPAARLEKYREDGRERFLTTEELVRLGDAIRTAESEGLAWDPDPDGKLKHAPKEENRRVRIGPHVAAAFRLLILSGCRLREILHLEWSQVDTERGVLWLPDSKTGKKAVVLGAAALEVIATIPRLGAYVIASPALDRPRHDLRKPWAAVTKAAGLEGLRIHDLRHHYASTGASAGMGLQVVGRLLGHTQSRTTEKYSHLADDAARRAANTISSTIASALGGGTSPTIRKFGREK